jgi:sulfur-oxidizing protein SoxZ
MATPQPKPRIKLDKKEARKGDIIEVKALVQHTMESGQRKDESGNIVPRKILNKFICTVAGKEVFSADFEPAVAANPIQVQGHGVRARGADLDRR